MVAIIFTRLQAHICGLGISHVCVFLAGRGSGIPLNEMDKVALTNSSDQTAAIGDGCQPLPAAEPFPVPASTFHRVSSYLTYRRDNYGHALDMF